MNRHMYTLISVFICSILSAHSQTSSELEAFNNSTIENEGFIGAVIEYGGIYNGTGEEQVKFNIEKYIEIVRNIKSKVDNISIVVFPEIGLQHTHGPDTTNIYGEPVPEGDRNITPCNSNDTVVLKALSCLAQESRTYLVVNLIERHNNISSNVSDFYNTNVVFNRNGTVIARYRKYNIYGIDGKPLKKPTETDFTFFDTDFGVRFGTFTCFDIAFRTPALDLVHKYNITHFVFPVGWVSELPFLTAIQMQAGWAHSNDVVLMASGLNDPLKGSTGSGIYAGNTVIGAYQTTTTKNFAVVANIPKKRIDFKGKNWTSIRLGLNSTKSNTTDILDLLKDRTEVYKSELLVENSEYRKGDGVLGLAIRWSRTEVENKKICYGSFCCRFTLNFTVSYLDSVFPHRNTMFGDKFGANEYHLVAFDGVRSYGGGIATGGIKVCAVVSCVDSNLTSCCFSTYNTSQKAIVLNSIRSFYKVHTIFHNISVETEVENSEDLFIMPDAFSRNPYPPSVVTGNQFGKLENGFDFKREVVAGNNSTKISMVASNELFNLGVFGVYSRLFTRDGMAATVSTLAPETLTESPVESRGVQITLQVLILFIISIILFINLKSYN